MRRPRRRTLFFLVLLMALSVALTLAVSAVFWKILRRDGADVLDYPLLALYAVLFLWVAIGFWTATFGFVREMLATPMSAPGDRPPVPRGEDGRTAIIMPVYNEDAAGVFAGIGAMYEELQATGEGGAFDFWVLSDTTDTDHWLEEEATWAALRAKLQGASGLYYRRRTPNSGKKAGNVKEFCERWGARYRYMIILDADSLMSGEAMVEMVRRMEQDPEIGLLQTASLPINQESLFARLQQFIAHFYGDVFMSGYALWTQVYGNYWGHNAIVRVRAFMECCGLPRLPGKPPLGGEILSHDFVEAAYLRHAGWKVVVDHDIRGSYEECPPNLINYATRDQRWCQGNLQHVRLTLAHGVRPVSRLHLGMGALSYLASPLWAIFLVLAVIEGVGFGRSPAGGPGAIWLGLSPRQLAIGLFAGTMVLLLLPKLWSLLVMLRRPGGLAPFGGGTAVARSMLLETAISTVRAPITMAFHTTFVAAALLGRSVQWEAQQREESRVAFGAALGAHAMHTIVGLGVLALVEWLAPGLLVWLSPVLFGLIFSIPVSMLLGSRRIGQGARERGLLLIPEEIDPPPVMRRQRWWLTALGRMREDAPHPFVRVVLDPALNALHVGLLESRAGGEAGAPEEEMERLRRVALAGGPDHLSGKQRGLLASDPAALRWLHREAWKEWPIPLLEKTGTSIVS